MKSFSKMKKRLLKSWIRNVILSEKVLKMDAGAAGSVSVDIPVAYDINIPKYAENIARAGDADKLLSEVLVFNELVHSVATESGNKNAWQSIAEKMLQFWGFGVEDQGSAGVTTFYDADKDGVYYSVKSSFSSYRADDNFSAATSSSSPKIESILALIIKEPDKKMLGNIGVIKTGNDENVIIRWGHVTAPISREGVVNNIVKHLPQEPVEITQGKPLENLRNRLLDALTKKPADADDLIKAVKKQLVKKLGMSDGRLNKKNMEIILGSDGQNSEGGQTEGAGSQIASLEVMDPDQLFEKTAKNLMKTVGSEDRAFAEPADRKQFMQQVKAYVRGLTRDDMQEVISLIIDKLGLSREQPPEQKLRLAAGYSRIAQSYIQEELRFRRHVREILLVEKFTKTDMKEIERISRKEAQKEITKVVGKDLQKTIKTEVEKILKNKATKEELANITKAVMKKLYKDIAVSYPQTIDRIKV
mgnify:CR=1 FL=1|tara:strand:+ start:222 stop:1643 length:1422 start_codon:yes stop_codon:yes gene_type:complete